MVSQDKSRARTLTERFSPCHSVGAVLKLFLWALFSSATIFMNKRLYSSGFPFPLASTAIGQAATALGGVVLVAGNVFPLRPVPAPSQSLRTLVPAIFATAGTLFAGNYAYLRLSLSFMQVRPVQVAKRQKY
jgi:hypothetical protein